MQTKCKKLLAMFLAVLMVVSALPMSVLAADEAAATATLVTDASELKAGDKVVIVAANVDYAMSTVQNGNNRGATTITRSGSTITLTSDVQILTLEVGTKEGTFAFNTGSGYLYAASSSKNYLRTESSMSDNSSWTVQIASSGSATVKAQGSNTRNWMQYNPNNGSPIFASYASGQQDISIYKLDATDEEPANPEPDPEMGYVQVTELDDIIAGGQFIIAVETDGSYKALGTAINEKIVPVDITVTDGIATTTAEMLPVWTLAPEGSGVSLSNGTSYLAYNSSTNFKSGDAAYEWTVVENGSGTFKIKIGPNESRAIAYGLANENFGAYASTASTYIYELYLFKYMELPGGTNPEPEQPTTPHHQPHC